MSIQFKQALTYPFKPENRTAMIWLPGAATYAVFIVAFIAALIIVVLGGDPSDATAASNFSNPAVTLANILYRLGELALQLASMVLGLGFSWRVIHRLQRDGLEATGPRWFEDFPRLVLDGLKASLYYVLLCIAITIPLVILVFLIVIFAIAVSGSSLSVPGRDADSILMVGIVILGILGVILGLFAGFILLGPFLYAPFVYAARTRRLGDLFALSCAWRFAARHYKSSLSSMLYLCLANTVYGFGTIALVVVTLGLGLLAVPFLTLAPYISMMHLVVQGLPIEADDFETAAIVPTSPSIDAPSPARPDEPA